jgi:acyl-CoA ligase (AMP-forming) (exosortase A-associated)
MMVYTVRDVLDRQASRAPASKAAIVDGAERLTCAELRARACSGGVLLKERGVRKGDRVGVFLRRSADAVAALFATWYAGGVAVVINDSLRTQQVQHILEHSEASCVVTDSAHLPLVPNLPSCGALDVEELRLAQGVCSPEPLRGADLALLIYTSGSTGLPKGVMLSHHNLLSGAQIVSDYLHLTDRDVILSILPFSFDYGLNQLLTALLTGGTLVVQRSLFPPDICRAIQREQITGLAGVPTLWQQMTGQQSPFLKTACPTLRYITNSGGRLPEHAVRLIRAAHPHLEIYLMYGLTEAFRSTYLPPDQVDRRPSSMGKAIPNVEILVINEEGRPCRPGEIGELVHRGANISLGYWRDPESTARILRPHPLDECRNGNPELVVYSGDLVTMDEEGYLYFVGRKDKLIKSRGVRVSREEIESCIYASSLVAHAVCFTAPRADADDEIVVAVIPGDPSRFREEALEEYCRREMPEYMRPRVIWPLDAFPLTTSNKPDRPQIELIYAEHRERAGRAAGAARTA